MPTGTVIGKAARRPVATAAARIFLEPSARNVGRKTRLHPGTTSRVSGQEACYSELLPMRCIAHHFETVDLQRNYSRDSDQDGGPVRDQRG